MVAAVRNQASPAKSSNAICYVLGGQCQVNKTRQVLLMKAVYNCDMLEDGCMFSRTLEAFLSEHDSLGVVAWARAVPHGQGSPQSDDVALQCKLQTMLPDILGLLVDMEEDLPSLSVWLSRWLYHKAS